jgi:hypothetical protein
MANDFYQATGSPSTRSSGSSSTMRAEFAAIEDAFDKLAPLASHALEILRINTGATGHESITPTQLLAALQAVITTPDQFDNDTSIATTLYAMRMGLRSNGSQGFISSAALSAADAGTHCRYASASAGTLTLPAASGLVDGSIIAFCNYGAGTLTVAADGSDLINALGLIDASSIKLQKSDSILLALIGSSWVQVSANNGVGMGQKWLNVTGSRAASTTYTNSTGKPIMVCVNLSNSTKSSINVTIDGITFRGSSSPNTELSGNYASFIVPPGSTYSVANNAGTSTVTSWAELRIG